MPSNRKKTRRESKKKKSRLLCHLKRSFKQYQNEHGSVKEAGPRKRQKPCNILTRKFSSKSSSTTHLTSLLSNPKILKALPKTFPYKMKPTKCPATEKKRGEKAKKKSQDCCVTFNPKNYLEILLSAHARTSQQSVQPVNGFVVCIIS